MKLLCSGDWHIRATPTRFRNSDYYNQMLEKIKYMIDFADKHNIYTILQPGDFFDSPDIPNRVVVDIIKLMGPIDVHVVFGQHDTKFRRTDDTTLAVLIESDVIDILSSVVMSYEDESQVDIYGASWGDDIPQVLNPNNYNILVIHKMIVEDKPLFKDQQDYVAAAAFSRKNKEFDLIVSGDNHNSFSYFPKNKGFPAIVNCGSLMRMTTAQYMHKPCFYIVDTADRIIERHYIPIKPVHEVFKAEAIEINERNEKMESFIETLSDTKLSDSKISFEDNLKVLLEKEVFDAEIKKLANEFIGNYYT